MANLIVQVLVNEVARGMMNEAGKLAHMSCGDRECCGGIEDASEGMVHDARALLAAHDLADDSCN